MNNQQKRKYKVVNANKIITDSIKEKPLLTVEGLVKALKELDR